MSMGPICSCPQRHFEEHLQGCHLYTPIELPDGLKQVADEIGTVPPSPPPDSAVPSAFYANAAEPLREAAWKVNCAIRAGHQAGVLECNLIAAAALDRMMQSLHALSAPTDPAIAAWRELPVTAEPVTYNTPPGTLVFVVEDAELGVTLTRTRSRVWDLCGSAVVKLEGRVGGYLASRCFDAAALEVLGKGK